MKESIFKMFIRRVIRFYKTESEVEMWRRRGVKIGENCVFYTANLDTIAPHLITIGNDVTITHAQIIVHDATTKRELGYTKLGRVTIGNNVFIGWGGQVLGNVVVGDNVIIGAGAVVTKDVPTNTVVAGNPAHFVCHYDESLLSR